MDAVDVCDPTKCVDGDESRLDLSKLLLLSVLLIQKKHGWQPHKFF